MIGQDFHHDRSRFLWETVEIFIITAPKLLNRPQSFREQGVVFSVG